METIILSAGKIGPSLFWPIFAVINLAVLFLSVLLLAWRENRKKGWKGWKKGFYTPHCKLHTWEYRTDDNYHGEYYCTICGFHTGYHIRSSF